MARNKKKESPPKTVKPRKQLPPEVVAKATKRHQQKARKPHRFRPGTVALREIRKLQKTTNLLLRKAPFERLIREVARVYSDPDKDGMRFQGSAITALQETIESMLIGVLSDAQRLAIHAHRITVKDSDVEMAESLRGNKGLESEERAVHAVLASNQ